MRMQFSFAVTILLSVSLFAAPVTQPVPPAKASPTIELGTRIGPVEDDVRKKMIKYIRSQGTLSGQVGEGPGYTSHIVAIRCRLPQGAEGKGDQPYCEYVEIKEPAASPAP